MREVLLGVCTIAAVLVIVGVAVLREDKDRATWVQAQVQVILLAAWAGMCA